MKYFLWLYLSISIISNNFAVGTVTSFLSVLKNFQEKINGTVSSVTSCSKDPQNDMSTVEIIRDNGYPGEEHFVTTEDGYILTLYRIPGLNGSVPVLLHHGLFDSSFGLGTAMGPEKGLAYVLSRRGYDVWIANSRGTTYSKNHTTLSSEDPAFWDFSYHEMGIYDLPADIKYIKSATNSSGIYYVGHSMGSTKFMILASTVPEVASNIRAAFLFGPAGVLADITGPLKSIFLAAYEFERFTGFNKSYELFSQGPFFKTIGKCICNKPILDTLCAQLYFSLFGGTITNFNASQSSLIFSHTPAGISLKTFIHFSQTIPTGQFNYYDYGSEKNKKIYSSEVPPEYDLTKIKVPIELYWSENDFVANEKTIEWLRQKIPSIVDVIKISDPEFGHIDYIWGINEVEQVYNKMLNNMKKYK